jgi:hypothetical protein
MYPTDVYVLGESTEDEEKNKVCVNKDDFPIFLATKTA